MIVFAIISIVLTSAFYIYSWRNPDEGEAANANEVIAEYYAKWTNWFTFNFWISLV